MARTNICVFLSRMRGSLISDFIRRMSNCDWSHAGFADLDTKETYSAMSDGKGLTWRSFMEGQEFLFLDAPGTLQAYQLAATWEHEPYDYRDIAGILLGQNWQSADRLICDVTVFKAFRLTNNRLVNPTFIPEFHFAPRDLLLSDKFTERKNPFLALP